MLGRGAGCFEGGVEDVGGAGNYLVGVEGVDAEAFVGEVDEEEVCGGGCFLDAGPGGAFPVGAGLAVLEAGGEGVACWPVDEGVAADGDKGLSGGVADDFDFLGVGEFEHIAGDAGAIDVGAEGVCRHASCFFPSFADTGG